MPSFQHEGIRFQFDTIGEGRPIIICHGLTRDRDQPKALLGTLPGHCHVVVDSRAHGDTRPLGPESKICFSQFARDLRALCAYLEIDSAIVGGISMGAGVATRFALDFPNLVRGLVVIRPAWAATSSPENLQVCRLIAQLFERYGEQDCQRAYDQHPLVRTWQQQDPQMVASMREQFDSPQAMNRRVRLVRMPGDCPIQGWQEIAALDIPALVIGNNRDLIHPLEMAQAWAQRLPQARFEQVPSKVESLEAHTRAIRRHVGAFITG